MKQRLAYDSETALITEHDLAPSMVCASFAASATDTLVLHRLEALSTLRAALRAAAKGEVLIVGHNIAYDLGVAWRTTVRLYGEAEGTAILREIFAAFNADGITDTQIREELLAIRNGDHRLRTKQRGSFSLAGLAERHLDLKLEKEDTWRMRYGELMNVPLDLWDEDAINYARDDATTTLAVYWAQGSGLVSPDEHDQVRAAWALHMMAVRGVRTDAEQIHKVRSQLQLENVDHRADALAKGYLRDNGDGTVTSDQFAIRREVIRYALETDRPVKLTPKGRDRLESKTNPAHRYDGVLELADKASAARMEAERLKAEHEAARVVAREAAAVKCMRGNIGAACRKARDARVEAAKAARNAAAAAYKEARSRAEDLERAAKAALEEVATGADVLKACEDSPALASVAKLKANEKILSTYLDSYDRGTRGALTSNPRVLVETGRTSWRGPNLQNQPAFPGVRECIVPRAGFLFAAVDYDSLELRVLAQTIEQLFGSSTLADQYRRDPSYDPHTAFASQLLGVSYAEGMRLKDAGDKDLKSARKRAKVANFGYPGGMGAASFVDYAKGYGLDVTEAEGAALKERWMEAIPEMRKYFNHVSDAVDLNGRIKLPASERVRGGCFYTSGCNYLFQGPAADGAKRAIYLLAEECYTDEKSPLWGSFPLIFVHDEVIMEVPDDREAADAASSRIVEVMVNAMETTTCKTVPVRAGATLMRRWSKSAVEAYDEQGRLIPWEDAQQ